MKALRAHQTEALDSLSAAIRGIVNLPTGTGKSLIQSRAIVQEIGKHTGTKVYVILSPRILLSNQLMGEVKNDLVENGRDCQYLVVHSYRFNSDYSEMERELNIPFRQIRTTTIQREIVEEYERAVRENVPLVISGTYHSAERIANCGIPVEILFCDEAHYLVQEQFSWIVSNPFPSKRAYYFTATLRETPSDDGLGMNNSDLFGEVLYQRKPVDMILVGEMVRPRMHLVDMSDQPEQDEADGLAVASAFNEHRSLVNVGPKLLVVAKDGSDHLDSIVQHPEIKRIQKVRPSLRVFDISTMYGARINGEEVNREQFLSELRSMSDTDEAIIVHHDILSEGIDVPGITGVMPLISQGKAKFLQTLGRATRLHVKDRVELYAETLNVNDLGSFIKPYAWLVVPIYGEFGEDFREELTAMIAELRDHGFNPAEDIVVRQKRGRRTPEPLEMVTEPTRAVRGILEFATTVLHDLEEEEKANELKMDKKKIKTTEDLFNVLKKWVW